MFILVKKKADGNKILRKSGTVQNIKESLYSVYYF